MDQQPLVSIIVPCYNSAGTIRRCLEALTNQRTDYSFEIVVVDSSSDETADIVRAEFPSVRLIRLPARTFAGAARNAGVRATGSGYCLMIDSDCVASRDLLQKAITRHIEGDYAAVGGSLKNGTPRSISGTVGYLIEFKEFMPSSPRRLERSVPTANVAYRRDVFERLGYFDEEMWLAEDILFNSGIVSSGERILFDPDLEVVHLNRVGWKKVLGYQTGLGRLSAVARARGNLPGKILLRYPLLVLLMPFVRTLNAFRWFARTDLSTLYRFLVLWPFYLVAATFWSYGFMAQVLEGLEPVRPRE